MTQVGNNFSHTGDPNKDNRHQVNQPNYNFGHEALVYKFPYNNPLFLDTEEILNWPFSDRILVTTFDLYKNDGFVQYLERTGLTLKKYLHDLGLNKNVKIMSDTGIFEFEAKKAKINLHTDFLPSALTVTEIFHAYELIDPDYLIAPDEIILLNDSSMLRKKKLTTIKENLLETLNRFPIEKVYATLQGIETQEIDYLLQFFADNDLKRVARGGLIPLRKADKSKYYGVLHESERRSRTYNVKLLHAFGLYSLRSIGDYLVINDYDSLDTSAIYWISANRQYILFSGRQIPVRQADLERCICFGCRQMDKVKEWAEISSTFIIFLYYHNAWQFTRIATQLHNDPTYARQFLPYYHKKNNSQIFSKIEQKSLSGDSNDILFFSAAEVSFQRKLEGSNTRYHLERINSKNYKRPPSRLVIISNCTSKKARPIPKELRFTEPNGIFQLPELHDKFSNLGLPARDQYKSKSHEIICSAVDLIKDEKMNLSVDHIIFSGVYGLIKSSEIIVPYDFNLSLATPEEKMMIIKQINLKKSIEQITSEKPDIIISTLSFAYQEVLSQLFEQYLDDLQRTELVHICMNHRDSGESHWTSYTIDEFYRLHKLGKLKRSPGRRFQAKANIVHEYCRILQQVNRKHALYFSDYWHSISDCLCWKE